MGPRLDAYTESLTDAGVFVARRCARAADVATTVRERDGQTQFTDGPFAETKEFLAGYYLIDCPDLDTALEHASRMPNVGLRLGRGAPGVGSHGSAGDQPRADRASARRLNRTATTGRPDWPQGQSGRPPACRVWAARPLASGPSSDSVSRMSVTVPECSETVAAVLPLGAAIASVGISLPEAVVPNAEIAPRIGVTDEWIVRRTGIRTRRVAAPDERLATHADGRGRGCAQARRASRPPTWTSCWSPRPRPTR